MKFPIKAAKAIYNAAEIEKRLPPGSKFWYIAATIEDGPQYVVGPCVVQHYVDGVVMQGVGLSGRHMSIKTPVGEDGFSLRDLSSDLYGVFLTKRDAEAHYRRWDKEPYQFGSWTQSHKFGQS